MGDIKSLVENELSFKITNEELQLSEQQAKHKLQWIISREGDSQGKRLQTGYLVQLIAESIQQNRLSQECMLKMDKKNAPPTKLTH